MINPNLKTLRFFIILLVGFFCNPPFTLFAQTDTATKDISTMFKTLQQEDIIKMTIETNTKLLVSKKYKEDWQPIKLTFNNASEESLEWTGKTRARGNIRKQVCYYPPMKIKLKKKWLVKNGLDSSFNDLKLVVGCKKGDYYGELVLKEYLTYKLYEVLTDYSFRTQLAEIEFIDTGGKWKPYTTYAFFIENEDEMATRLNARCAKPKRLRSKYIYADQLDKMALFEYMVGNTDWSVHTSHNVRILKCNDYPLPLPVAYDFDYSGLVNAPYAIHGEGIDLDHITQRLYLGMCREEGVIEKQIPLFQEKKAQFYKVVQDFPYLDKKEKKGILKYLDDFYEVIDNPKSFRRNIADLCRENGR